MKQNCLSKNYLMVTKLIKYVEYNLGFVIDYVHL